MEPLQPASREQIVAIIRQRAERHREFGPEEAGPQFLVRRPPRDVNYVPQVPVEAAMRPPPIFRQATIEDEERPRLHNMSLEGNILSCFPHNKECGVYISGKRLTWSKNYFEIEILNKSPSIPEVAIGLASRRHPITREPLGLRRESIAYYLAQGIIFKGRLISESFGSGCDVGDRIGCGIRLPPERKFQRPLGNPDLPSDKAIVFFTRNGKEIGNFPFACPEDGFFPAVSLEHPGEVLLKKRFLWSPEEEHLMMVDSSEDEWLRLHDVRLNGTVLEYIGRGKSPVDVGLAQARQPIGTTNHYFEIEIIDPGLNCYIAVGLARRDYPRNRHPGWNQGSIAYHADDGKVFTGSGTGAPFGPRCHKGDVMGCGVLFPRNYEQKSDSAPEADDDIDDYLASFNTVFVGSDSGDDEEWNFIQSGAKVQIYFTRNGKMIGKKEVRIPNGGFYPTVGMMSSDEKVRVDLRPLSG